MKINSIKFISLLLCAVYISCSTSKNREEYEAYKIYSLLIDDFGRPPPPPPPGETYSLNEKQLDSLYNQIQKIGIQPNLIIRREKFSKNTVTVLDNEFNKLIEQLVGAESRSLINLSKIKIKRPYQLSIY